MGEILHQHDLARLGTLSNKIDSSPSQTVSFEGEPLYADQDWGRLHEFSYGTVIPALLGGASLRLSRLGVLYDDFTVEQTRFSCDHFLELIMRSLERQVKGVQICVDSEREMLDRARVWVGELTDMGMTRRFRGISELHLPGQNPVSLTTGSGRPTCAVLDAVYQTTKSEQGFGTVVLAHSTNFRGQQRDMQAVLMAVHGEIPFDSFANVFIRERNGLMRLGPISLLNRAGNKVDI